MKAKKPKITDYFPKDQIGPLPEDLTGKVVAIAPHILDPLYLRKENLLWRAEDGFGCHHGLHGTAVFCINVVTGMKTRFERYDFVGEFLGELPADA